MRTIWQSHQGDLFQEVRSQVPFQVLMHRRVDEFDLRPNLVMKSNHHYEFDGFQHWFYAALLGLHLNIHQSRVVNLFLFSHI
jgi:hypothetical protein